MDKEKFSKPIDISSSGIAEDIGKEPGKPKGKFWYPDLDNVEKEVSLELAMQLAKLPEEQRRQIIETYALLKQVEKGESSAILLPLLIGFTRTNSQAQQTTSPEVLIEIEKLRMEWDIRLKELEFKTHVIFEETLQEVATQFVEMLRKLSEPSVAIVVPHIPPPPVNIERIKCMKCGKLFYVDALAKYVVCAECGAILVKGFETSGAEKPLEDR